WDAAAGEYAGIAEPNGLAEQLPQRQFTVPPGGHVRRFRHGARRLDFRPLTQSVDDPQDPPPLIRIRSNLGSSREPRSRREVTECMEKCKGSNIGHQTEFPGLDLMDNAHPA